MKRRSFKMDEAFGENRTRTLGQLGCLMIFAAPFFCMFGGAWMLAEGPGPDGGIHGSPLGAYSPFLFIAAVACLHYGSRFVKQSLAKKKEKR